jgi:DNA-binding beta-propeller fold protein YncE
VTLCDDLSMSRPALPIKGVVTREALVDDLKVVIRAGLGRPRLDENKLPALKLVVARLGDQDPPDLAVQVERILKPSIQRLGDSKPGKAASLLFGTAKASAHLRMVRARRELAAELYDVEPDTFYRVYESRVCEPIANDLLDRYRAAAPETDQTIGSREDVHERVAPATPKKRTHQTIATLYEPTAMALDPVERRLFVVERAKHRVVQVGLADGSVAPVAGIGERGFSGDGMDARLARLDRPDGVAFDVDRQLLYIADTDNHRVRRVHLPTGQITTVAGSGHRWPGSRHRSYLPISADRLPATRAKLTFPRGLALNHDGTQLFIAAAGSSTVRVLRPANDSMFVLAGNGKVADTGDGHRRRRVSLAVPVRLAFHVEHQLLYVSQERSPAVRYFGSSYRQELVQTVPGTDTGTRPTNHRKTMDEDNPGGSVIALDQSKNYLYASASPGIARIQLPDGSKSIIPRTDGLGHIGDILFESVEHALYISLRDKNRVVRVGLA